LKKLILFCALIGMVACQPARRLADQNISSVYQISDNTPLPVYTIFQFTSDSLRLYFSVPARSARAEKRLEGTPTGFRMHVSLFSANDRNTVYDSATYFFQHSKSEDGMVLSGAVDLFSGDPTGRILSVTLDDLELGSSNEQLFPGIPSWPPGRFHYRLTDMAGNPILSNHITTSTQFSVISSIVQDQQIRVRYYKDEFPVAWPPFAVVQAQYFDYRADSIFDVSFTAGSTQVLRFSRPGIYHITADTASREGYTLFVRELPFPWITQPSQMVAPLRYITSTREYEALSTHPDPKEAVDQFWLANTGNELRARKVIREYYRRIEKANFLFTSYQDGWKTDRGMIYIMYGAPTIVQRTDRTEVWTYGESRHLLSITFVFIKMNNPFTDNDYLLERSTNYKTGWHQMVTSWRR
jgi:GWxTD domain-containing protein